MNNNKIAFVTCMHGNEQQPMHALARARIPHIVANPRAVKQNVRWVDKDLNSSFKREAFDDTVEGLRAPVLLQLIPEDTTVIDFHTSDTANVPFCIITDKAMLPLAKRTGIPNIVLMSYNIKKGGALIDVRNGVAIECGMHADTTFGKGAIEVVHALLNDTQSAYAARVFETICEITAEGNYVNLEQYTDPETDESFFPLFTGKSTYSFIGLKCKEITNVV